MQMTQTTVGAGETRVTTMVGRAAEDLPDGAVRLRVLVPQLMPAASGEVAPGTTDALIKTRTPGGKPEQTRATTTNTITASYIGKSNSKYPPSVRKGEQITVVQFGDTDQYYWESVGRDPELRQLEVIRIEVSDKTTLKEDLTDDNTYFFEINTKEGTITLKTSSSNDEKVRYLVNIDTKKSMLYIGDDHSNSLFIDSLKPEVRMANTSGSMLDLLGPDINIVAPQDAVIKAGRQVVFDAPVMTQQASGGGVCVFNTGAMTINASTSFTIKAPVVGVLGQLQVGGAITASGGMLAPSYATGVGPTPVASTTNILAGTGAAAPAAPADASPAPEARHSAAAEQIIELAAAIEGLFAEVNASIGVPLDTTTLQPIATSSEMSQNTGT